MKNLCYFLRQNIVQKPSMAGIKEGRQILTPAHSKQQNLFMSIDKCIKALLYILNLRIINRAIFAAYDEQQTALALVKRKAERSTIHRIREKVRVVKKVLRLKYKNLLFSRKFDKSFLAFSFFRLLLDRRINLWKSFKIFD